MTLLRFRIHALDVPDELVEQVIAATTAIVRDWNSRNDYGAVWYVADVTREASE